MLSGNHDASIISLCTDLHSGKIAARSGVLSVPGDRVIAGGEGLVGKCGLKLAGEGEDINTDLSFLREGK